MGTLLKCYKPLFPLRFIPIPNSVRTSGLPTHHSHAIFSNSKVCGGRCFSSVKQSQPLIDEKNSGGEGVENRRAELWLYNTMSRQKEVFKPKVDGRVGMYVCGVTAYDLSHIGHARVYVSFDVLYRYLRHLEYEVNYVRNFTDVDDKIIARANELGEDPINLSRRYCQEFHVDMTYLHCLPPSVEPCVSDHMPQIIDMIKQIIDNDCAYRVEGDVYFSVEKFPEYGRLSGRKVEDNRAGERVAVDSRKKNPADFALWKVRLQQINAWDPLHSKILEYEDLGEKDLNYGCGLQRRGTLLGQSMGPGRPGWHIECSAMSAAYLGYSFDIHGGGMDLVFPHHEMKLLRVVLPVNRVIDIYHPLALRLFLIGTHYRSPINYSDVQLESASDRVFYIYQTLHDCQNAMDQDDMTKKDSVPPHILDCINKFYNDFLTSMSDDLHTPNREGMGGGEGVGLGLDTLYTGKKQELRLESLAALEKVIRDVLTILGLMPASYSEALLQLREKALKRSKLTEDHILQKIEERTMARKNKEYEKSDAIRKDLAAVGIALMDSPDGTTWRPAIPLALQEQVAAT
ncbi:Cysteine--tRNA ligase, chloroplastic/mitochondrial [Vitis vinifera]|uniref:cysteine--tRNA ligase n=1 Tax=Vitis vinifera TaxID=29760 RepID=A0A438CJY1_VITVI|nr:Cysteine--tRNA ligase, chloroplastic/mitochondrial [Vitis vinifera]